MNSECQKRRRIELEKKKRDEEKRKARELEAKRREEEKIKKGKLKENIRKQRRRARKKKIFKFLHDLGLVKTKEEIEKIQKQKEEEKRKKLLSSANHENQGFSGCQKSSIFVHK